VTKIACRHRESQFPKISMKSALSILKEHAVLQYTENNKIKLVLHRHLLLLVILFINKLIYFFEYRFLFLVFIIAYYVKQ